MPALRSYEASQAAPYAGGVPDVRYRALMTANGAQPFIVFGPGMEHFTVHGSLLLHSVATCNRYGQPWLSEPVRQEGHERATGLDGGSGNT